MVRFVGGYGFMSYDEGESSVYCATRDVDIICVGRKGKKD